MPKLLLLDTETTGFGETDEPIEVAFSLIEVSAEGHLVEEIRTYSGLRQPSVAISAKAQSVHGIKATDVYGKELDNKLIKELIESADILVAHNADFDARMLRSIYPGIMEKVWRCTYRQWPWPKTSCQKLADAAMMLGIEIKQTHRALEDVNVLKDCLLASYKERSYCAQLINAGPHRLGRTRAYSALNSAKALTPETQYSCSELLGLINGLKADNKLVDEEIEFLENWIRKHPELEFVWPITEVIQMLEKILRDGIVTDDERSTLSTLLDAVSQSTFKAVFNAVRHDELRFDEIDTIAFEGKCFCLTGNFLNGSKELCASVIQNQGGSISNNITKKINFLIVGALGSPDWKHGNFGTKVEKAVKYRTAGAPLKIIHEQTWTNLLKLNKT